MAKISFEEYNPRKSTLALITKCNEILENYANAGYNMTVRQVYYQLVAADEIENSERSYNKIQETLNKARLGGLIDWDCIVDRTRELRRLPTWDKPQDILRAVSDQFRIDKWASQTYRPEVWIEKDALVGIFEGICQNLQTPVLSCRGYASLSEMFEAGYRRYRDISARGQIPVILHFGDHDPSGIDMSRDIISRVKLLSKGVKQDFVRLALNMNQVEQYRPPPNFAKLTDTRSKDYVTQYGPNSWELDALTPDVLTNLVTENVLKYRDETLWQNSVQIENEHKKQLRHIYNNYDQLLAA